MAIGRQAHAAATRASLACAADRAILNRRQLLISLLGAPVVAVVLGDPPARRASRVATYGYLTPEICFARGLENARAHVFFNGEDVTKHLRVMAAHDERGYIDILKRNPTGGFYFENGELARERRYGHVRVTFI